MKILIDMNFSPQWQSVLRSHGHTAVHWSEVGEPAATDRTILEWARRNNCIILTHDLDFGAILAAAGTDSPSVIQVRIQDILPVPMESLLVSVLKQFETTLTSGALISVNEERTRARVLPLIRHPRNR